MPGVIAAVSPSSCSPLFFDQDGLDITGTFARKAGEIVTRVITDSFGVYGVGITRPASTIEVAKQRKFNLLDINRLITMNLNRPLSISIEDDADGYIARSLDLPLFGYGDDIVEATDALKHEIESLVIDLSEDDNFTEEWLEIKRFLRDIVSS